MLFRLFRLFSKKDISPFATGMILQDVMLSGMDRHRRTNAARSPPRVRSLTVGLREAESGTVVARGGEEGKRGDVGPGHHVSSTGEQMSKFWSAPASEGTRSAICALGISRGEVSVPTTQVKRSM